MLEEPTSRFPPSVSAPVPDRKSVVAAVAAVPRPRFVRASQRSLHRSNC